MALRLIEMVSPEKDGGDVRELLEGHNVIEHRQVRLSDGEVLVRIRLDAEQSEAVLNVLENRNTAGRSAGETPASSMTDGVSNGAPDRSGDGLPRGTGSARLNSIECPWAGTLDR